MMVFSNPEIGGFRLIKQCFLTIICLTGQPKGECTSPVPAKKLVKK